MKKELKKNQKGFTLIELIIVIAVMGIIAAVLVPSFTQMTLKSKVSTDVRSLQIVQRQLELYVAEHNGNYPNIVDPTAGTEAQKSVEQATDVVNKLIDAGYLEAKSETSDDDDGWKRLGLQSGANLAINEVTSGGQTVYNLALQYNDEADTKLNKMVKGLAGGTDGIWVVSETDSKLIATGSQVSGD